MVYGLLGLVGGLAVGALLAVLAMRRKVAQERQGAVILRSQLNNAGAAQTELAELRTHLSGLRHDIRGILSPALLVADRLVGHQEPGIRRAGEVMIRTVDRATTRLAETRLDQEGSNNPQG